jgi:hypothetical protein
MPNKPRTAAVLTAMVLFCASRTLGEPGGAAPGREDFADWTRLAPGDARFYVELRDLAEIRRLFQHLGIWRTVRELADRDVPGATTQRWQHTTGQYLKLGPETMIAKFLGRRAALVAAESAQWENGVVLAELEKASDLPAWLRRWQAKPLADEGAVHRYELPGGILLAACDNILAFGPAGDPDGLWGRTVLLLVGRRGPMLAGRSEFAALRSRLSADYPGLLYVVWPEGDPAALEQCTRLLIGVSVSESQISCELRGQRSAHAVDKPPLQAAFLRALPASTLAVQTGSFQFAGLSERVKTERRARQDPLLSMLSAIFADVDKQQDGLIKSLGPAYAIVVGEDRSPDTSGLEIPAVTVITEAQGGESYVERLDWVVRFVAKTLTRLAALDEEAVDPPALQIEDCEGLPLHHIEIGPILAKRSGIDLLSRLDLAWALWGERLVLSTSASHVREIIRADRGIAPRMENIAEIEALLPREAEPPAVTEWSYVRASALSEMITGWIKYLGRERPEALRQEWWQQWAEQRLEQRTRLGVGLVPDSADPHRAVVKEIARRSPASRFLHVGDVVVGAAGAPLTTTRPAQEVAQRYASRGDSRQFRLQILREGELKTVLIPVAPATPLDLRGFDPIRALRQLAALSRRAHTVTVWRYAGGPERFDARILIRWEPVKQQEQVRPRRPESPRP